MARVALLVLLLVACGSPPAATCRSNDDCPVDRVCIAGACGSTPGGDSGPRDSGGDAGAPNDANADAPLGPPPGETCANPILLQPVAAGAGENPFVRWTGELGDYADDAFPDCSGPDIHAPDILFEIERPSAQADIFITTSPAGLDTIIALDNTCDGRFSWACNDDRSDSAGDVSSAIFVWHYDPSVSDHLFLIVDGGRASVTSGMVSVAVELRAPSSTDCSGPMDLSGGGEVLAFAPPSAPPNQGDCAGAVVPGDVVFRIGDATMPAGRFGTESSDFPVSLRLMDAACTSSSICAPTMGDASYHFTDLSRVADSGYGFVVVEGLTSRSDGTFMLDYNP